MSALQDTQSQPDFREIAIDRVGVRDLLHPGQIREKTDALQSTVAKVSLAVDLPHHYKGTHMSRFIEVLNGHGPLLDVKTIARLPRELLERLNATRAHTIFEFPFFLGKKAPATGAAGIVDYGVVFEVNASGNEIDFVVTVKVPVTTLCPCSKAISARGATNKPGAVSYPLPFASPI